MLTFMIIGGIGLFILTLTSILSQFTPHDSDIGFGGDHDVPSFDHDTGTVAQTDVQETGPSPLSLRTISVFCTVFGASGTLAMYYGASTGVAVLISLVAAFIFANLIYRIIKAVYKQQGNSNIHVAEYLNMLGRSTTAISETSPGHVYVSIGDQRRDLLAYTKSGVNISTNTQVKIIEIHGNSVIVEPVTTS